MTTATRALGDRLVVLARDLAAALADGHVDIAEVVDIAGDLVQVALAVVASLPSVTPEERDRRREDRRRRRDAQR